MLTIQQILEQQDELLDRFHSKVGAITDVVIGISEELDTHDEYVERKYIRPITLLLGS